MNLDEMLNPQQESPSTSPAQPAEQVAPAAPAAPAAAPASVSLDVLLNRAIANTPTAPLSAGVGTTGIDDPSMGGNEYDVYKAVKGQKHRLSVLNPAHIFHARTHFVDGKGFLLCMSEYKRQGDREVAVNIAPCCQRLDRSKRRFSALVLQYATEPNGKLARPFSYAMKVWRFNEKTFGLLRDVHANFPLNKHDIQIACEDEKYQTVSVTPLTDSVVGNPQFVSNFGQDVATWVMSMQPLMERTVARKLDAAGWAEVLKTPASATLADEPPVSLDELLK